MPGLLVIDDDPSIALVVRQAVSDSSIPVLSADTAQAGCELVTRERPDVIILDVLLPDQSGLAIIDHIQQVDAKVPVIFVTARGTSHTAIEAMRQGAYDFLVKPLDLAQLRQVISRALEIRWLTRVPVEVRETSELSGAGSDLLIGRSSQIQQVYKAIGQVAEQDLPVLISGETGTGKELVARAIHHYSRRSAGPFVSVNCSASNEPSLERALFGGDHPGTKPTAGGLGHLGQAAGGTLLLDEVSELPLALQSKILNLIQKQSYQRLRGADPQDRTVRLLASTSRELEPLVAQGRFRPDLFYHLSGFSIRVPPLRDRLEDIPALARHFVLHFNRELGKRVYRVAPETLEILAAYHWPGNIRELESVLKQALVRTTGAVLIPEFLPANVVRTTSLPGPAIDAEQDSASATDWNAWVEDRLVAGSTDIYAEAQSLMDRHVLTHLLRHTGGNQAQTARLLGMTRASLRTRIRALGIVIDRQVDVHDEPSEALAENS